MKIVFDVDLEQDNLDEKLKQLIELENSIRDAKMYRVRKDGEGWLMRQPEKPFY